MQENFFTGTFLKSIDKINFYCSTVFSFSSFSLGNVNWCNLGRILALSLKPINPKQKYPLIIESFACILQIFVLIFLFIMIYQFLLENIQLQSYQIMLNYCHLHKTLFNEFLLICTHQNLIRFATSFISGKLFLD